MYKDDGKCIRGQCQGDGQRADHDPEGCAKGVGVESGDRVSFIVEGNTVRIVNSAVYAMQMLQREMAGEAERAGLKTDDDVLELLR